MTEQELRNSEFGFYVRIAEFRIKTLRSINSKRSDGKVLADIDKTLLRICNAIDNGYVLEEHESYPYFIVKKGHINTDKDLKVTIERYGMSLHITEEEWAKFRIWTRYWKTPKPANLSECLNVQIYIKWW